MGNSELRYSVQRMYCDLCNFTYDSTRNDSCKSISLVPGYPCRNDSKRIWEFTENVGKQARLKHSPSVSNDTIKQILFCYTRECSKHISVKGIRVQLTAMCSHTTPFITSLPPLCKSLDGLTVSVGFFGEDFLLYSASPRDPEHILCKARRERSGPGFGPSRSAGRRADANIHTRAHPPARASQAG